MQRNFSRLLKYPLSRFSASSIIPPKNSKFSALSDKDLSFFEGVVDRQGGMVTDSDDLLKYNQDWSKKFTGQGKIVLRPKTTDEVSALLKYCNDRRLAVVP